jgi:hypothetical protein
MSTTDPIEYLSQYSADEEDIWCTTLCTCMVGSCLPSGRRFMAKQQITKKANKSVDGL